MSTLELRFLGGLEVRLEDGPVVRIPTRKARLLLGFLALPPGRPQPREKLATLLWSDRSDAQARHCLRQSLSTLRRALARAGCHPLLADRRAIRLDPAAVTVDVFTFEELLASPTVQAIQQACALYRGELFEGEYLRDQPFEEWLSHERTRLHDLALQAFERLLIRQSDAGETDGAVATAQELLRHDPAHEGAHRRLMHLYAAHGRHPAALEQYRRCQVALERDLDVIPGSKTEQLYQDILQGRLAPCRAGSIGRGGRSVAPSSPDSARGEPPAREPEMLPARPTVAVLPFVDLGGAAEEAHFCEGITEDIITNLTRFRELNVVVCPSSLADLRRFGDPSRVMRSMGVQHVVHGSVQRGNHRVRVSVRLIDTESGSHVWAERYDRDLEDIFALQDEIAGYVVGHVANRIDDQRSEAASRRQPPNLQAYDYWCRARKHIDGRSLTGVAEGRRLLDQALEIDPSFARAYADLGRSYNFETQFSADGTTISDKHAQALRLTQMAVDLDGTDARTLVAKGWSLLCCGQFGTAAEQFDGAGTLNPYDADSLMQRSLGGALMGDTESSCALIDKASQLNPFNPDWHRLHFVVVMFLAGRYDEAYKHSRRAPELQPDSVAWKAASCVRANRLDEARDFVDRFVHNVRSIWTGKKRPDSGAYARYLLAVNPLRREADAEHLLDSLRRAGLPQ